MRVLSFSDIAGEARKKETNDDKRANKSHSSLAIVGQAHTVCSILLNKVDGLIVHVAGMLSNAPRFIVFNFSLLSYAISCVLRWPMWILTTAIKVFLVLILLPNQTSSGEFIFGHFHSSRFYTRLLHSLQWNHGKFFGVTQIQRSIQVRWKNTEYFAITSSRVEIIMQHRCSRNRNRSSNRFDFNNWPRQETPSS